MTDPSPDSSPSAAAAPSAPRSARPAPAPEPTAKVRLQRVLADAAVAARRVCERLIEEGRVEVNGAVVHRLPAFVDPYHDHITVDGRPIPKAQRPLYLMFNKPTRVLTSKSPDPLDSRRAVADLVQHPAAPRLVPVGALEYDTAGLLLLTNDGDLVNHLTHPRYEVPKTYLVYLQDPPPPEALAALQRGIYVATEGFERWHKAGQDLEAAAPDTAPSAAPSRRQRARLKPTRAGRVFKARLIVAGRAPVRMREDSDALPARTVLEIETTEGRDAMVIYALLLAGCAPKRLVRVGLGPLELKGVALGAWRELTRPELKVLRAAAKGATQGRKVPGLSRPDEWRADVPPAPAANFDDQSPTTSPRDPFAATTFDQPRPTQPPRSGRPTHPTRRGPERPNGSSTPSRTPRSDRPSRDRPTRDRSTRDDQRSTTNRPRRSGSGGPRGSQRSGPKGAGPRRSGPKGRGPGSRPR